MPVERNICPHIPEDRDIEEIIENVKSGKSGSFGDLLARYTPMISSIVSSYDLSKVPAEREDLLQEASISLYKAAFAYNKNVASFTTFAHICIRRGISTALKKIAKGHADLFTDDEEKALSKTADYSNMPEICAINYESLRDTLDKIECLLSPFEKKVLSFFLSGKPYDEIARRLNGSRKSVDNAMVRIREKLKVLNLDN